uniref:Charged multivesicular body protein 6a n=1 Tax=Eptatretus burgeri TaxID=7764 RepID=A0A8C4NEQ4_EPTBU
MGNVFNFNLIGCMVWQPELFNQLKQQRDKLRQYQKRIELQLEKERDVARRLLKNGQKSYKKRYQEQLLEKTDAQITNLENMVQDLEFAQIEIKVMEGLKVGNDSLKKMHEQVMSIEDVERIMEETEEGIAYQREIDDLLAGGLSDEDEDAVLTELEQITQVCFYLLSPCFLRKMGRYCNWPCLSVCHAISS